MKSGRIISVLLSALILMTVFVPVLSPASGEAQSFTLHPDTRYVVPGGSALFSIYFSNDNAEDATLSADMLSLNPRMSWNLILDNESVKTISVPPASSISALLSVSVPATMPIGAYSFSLKISGDTDTYLNGSVVVETPVLSLSSPEVREDGDYVTFSLNITATGNVSASNVVVSLYIDGKASDTMQFSRVPTDSAVPVSMRGSMGPGPHSYEITAATLDGYSPVHISGTEVVNQPARTSSYLPYVLLSVLIILIGISQLVRLKRRRARLVRESSKTSLRPDEMLRMDSKGEEE